MGFPRQELGRGFPFLYPRDLTDPRIEPRSLALQVDSLPLSHLGSPISELGPVNNLNFSGLCVLLVYYDSGIICLLLLFPISRVVLL